MRLDTVLCKTALARELLQQRDTIPRHQRLFIIMVDGQKTLGELAAAAKQLGIDHTALSAMVNSGLLAPIEPSSRTRIKEAGPPPAPPSSPSFSLAAAKLYSMDLVALMLPGEDADLREAARDVIDAAALRAWITLASIQIGQRSSDERAQFFLSKVNAMLPAGFHEDI
jgi:hypothetical protein